MNMGTLPPGNQRTFQLPGHIVNIKDALLRLAVQGLQSFGFSTDGPVRFQATAPDGGQFSFQGTVKDDELLCDTQLAPEETCPAMTPPISPPNPEWLWLSDMEKAIVRAATTEYQTAKELAARAGYQIGTTFRVILNNMVERKILESAYAGYRLRQTISD